LTKAIFFVAGSIALAYNFVWLFLAIRIKRRLEEEPANVELQRSFKRGDQISRASLGAAAILYLLFTLERHGLL
jgi:hypothetical protein